MQKQILFLAILMNSQPAYCDDLAVLYSGKCNPQSPNTHDINVCSYQAYQKSEDALNAAYKHLVSSLSKDCESQEKCTEIKKLLIASQRGWIIYRENDCGAIYEEYAEGSIRTSISFQCLRLHAERRTLELKNYPDYWHVQ